MPGPRHPGIEQRSACTAADHEHLPGLLLSVCSRPLAPRVRTGHRRAPGLHPPPSGQLTRLRCELVHPPPGRRQQRVSAAEIEHGLVTISPNFEPLSMLADNEPYDQLLDGEPLVEIFPDLDGLADRGCRSTRSRTRQPSSSRRIGCGRWACERETWSDSAPAPRPPAHRGRTAPRRSLARRRRRRSRRGGCRLARRRRPAQLCSGRCRRRFGTPPAGRVRQPRRAGRPASPRPSLAAVPAAYGPAARTPRTPPGRPAARLP